VFEPNDEPSGRRSGSNVGAFTHDLLRQEPSRRDAEAGVFVKCDGETTT
jgi:hypothetical protein